MPKIFAESKVNVNHLKPDVVKSYIITHNIRIFEMLPIDKITPNLCNTPATHSFAYKRDCGVI